MAFTRLDSQLIEDALAIWRASVDAVDSERLVMEHVRVDGDYLLVGDESASLSSIRRIAVVGAGKAGAGMARGLEKVLGAVAEAKQLAGWVNVPADCVQRLQRIHLHAARPAGLNEPTAEGIVGTERILSIVGALSPQDLCICLLSGGGSALLPAPVEGVSLADKQLVTRHLSAAGANIQELNTVRKQLSRIKGGRLARQCRAGRLITLVISDVLGDPLDVIASGPTVEDQTQPRDALAVLEQYDPGLSRIPQSIVRYLREAAHQEKSAPSPTCRVVHQTIGNNAVAVDAAGIEAERRGYNHAMIAARVLEEAADEIGRHLAEVALQMRCQAGPNCLISGGEPTVKLAPPERRGLGGRNQQLVLAALCRALELRPDANPLEGIVLLSGGTDGEDGPTDAAGAMAHRALVEGMRKLGLSPQDYLKRNDAYHFFDTLQGLIKTGPTHTNVCDVRVIVCRRN